MMTHCIFLITRLFFECDISIKASVYKGNQEERDVCGQWRRKSSAILFLLCLPAIYSIDTEIKWESRNAFTHELSAEEEKAIVKHNKNINMFDPYRD